VVELHAGIAPGDVVDMYAALLRFTDRVHPDRLDHVNAVLSACKDALQGR
jgi:hypothetical protein